MEGSAGASGGTTEATQQLEVFRERMLRMLVVVSLACVVPVILALTPRSLRDHNYLYMAFSWAVILDLLLIAALRRKLPLAVRAWMFAAPGLAHPALLLPVMVDPVGLASAVACTGFVTALAGIRSGVAYGVLLLALLGTGSYLAPWSVDPAVVAAIRSGPLRPGVIAIGAMPLVGMMAAAVHIVLRGMVRGFDEALAGLRAAQQSDRRFRGVFETTPDPILLLRLSDTTYLDVNPAFERVFGWRRAEVIGRPAEDVPVLRADDGALLLRRVAEGQEPGELELAGRRRDGRELNVALTARAAEVGGERVALIVARDVTLQRQLESAVRHAQRIETTGALAGGIAHNFRNALGAILPNLDVCLEEAPEPLQPALRDARAAASAAVDLATKLTRIARREVSGAPKPVALGELLGEVTTLCRSTFGARLAVGLDVVEDGVSWATAGSCTRRSSTCS